MVNNLARFRVWCAWNPLDIPYYPDGKTIAKNLRGEAIKSAVERALGKH